MTATTSRRVAHLVGEIFSPLIVDAVLLLAIAIHSAPSLLRALEWTAIAAGFVAAIPALIIQFGVRRRRLTDHHVRAREQRPKVIVLAFVSMLIGLAILFAVHAARELIALIVAMLVGLFITLLITLRWKVSLHTGTFAGAIVVLAIALGPLFLALLPLVVLVAWSRVELGDHSPVQAGVGAILGLVVAGVVFSALR
jgi:membrane-associated phospholipid phosphatase